MFVSFGELANLRCSLGVTGICSVTALLLCCFSASSACSQKRCPLVPKSKFSAFPCLHRSCVSSARAPIWFPGPCISVRHVEQQALSCFETPMELPSWTYSAQRVTSAASRLESIADSLFAAECLSSKHRPRWTTSSTTRHTCRALSCQCRVFDHGVDVMPRRVGYQRGHGRFSIDALLPKCFGDQPHH